MTDHSVWQYDRGCMRDNSMKDDSVSLYECLTVWKHGSMIVWQYDCMTVWLYEIMTVCMTVWKYDSMIVW